MRNFKATTSNDTADALGDLNINGDDGDDEYDFMDDEAGAARQQRDGRQAAPKSKFKYMNLLQDVADRTISNITIELDDLDEVRVSGISIASFADSGNSTRNR